MGRIISSSVLLSSILLSAVITDTSLSYIGSVSNVYAQNTWYLGKGVQPNTYYTYKIQDYDTKEGQPYIMTIYFKHFNSTGNYWVAPTFVIYQGKAYSATLHLSNLDLTPLGTSKISPDMQDFVSGYKDSLAWLAAFVPKPGLSLTAPSWGNIGGNYLIAAMGGAAVAPSGSTQIKVPAGTFDATLVTLHYGVDNHIYVNANVPYPLKAKVFAATTGANPPVEYAFDLEATGQGQPPIPKNQLIVPKPPITIQTTAGTYFIEIVAWQPPTITAGKPTQFALLFKDTQQNVVNGVTYSIKATEGNHIVADINNQHAADGTGIQTISFPKPGPANMVITIDAVGGVPTGEFVESSTFNLIVT
jgi:hypothetical protein